MTIVLAITAAGPVVAAVKNHTALQQFPLGAINAEGWLKENLTRSKHGMGGHLDELEPELIGKPYVTRDHKPPQSPGWSAEIAGEYWTGLVELAFTLNDEELKAKARKWVDAFLTLQEPDGFLGAHRTNDNRAEDYCAWGANWGFRALLAWHSATGDRRVPDALRRGLLWFVENWKPDPKNPYASPIIIESMLAVYQLTGEPRLLQWCQDYFKWFDEHDIYFHCPKSFLRPELDYNDVHSVAFMEMVALPLLQYASDGDPRMRDATLGGIRQVKAKCWQCSGVPTCNDEHLVPPSCNHETEYCAIATTALTFAEMARILGEAHWGDDVERAVFNAGQGARKADERAIAYMTSPNQFFATRKSSMFGCDRDMDVYAPNYPVACCPAQSVRLYPEFVRSMFLCDTDGNLALPMYGPCSLTTKDVRGSLMVREETNYPFDGKIVLTVNASPAREFALRLKAPRWNTGFTLTVNGAEVAARADAKGWLDMRREWGEGDKVEIEFAMKPVVRPCEDVYFPNEPLRTVECGPLLYVMPIAADWRAWSGTPITKLPDGWSWFDVHAKEINIYTLTRSLGEGAQVITRDTQGAYPWETSPTVVRVPMKRARERVYNYYRSQVHAPRWTERTPLPYGNPVTPDDDAPVEMVELVPFGCANLRLTCWTVEK